MKVAVIFTGGTIGSNVTNSASISLSSSARYDLLSRFFALDGSSVAFECFEPFTILSENLNADICNRLLDSVESVLKQQAFDGIIITHGSDTLDYSAALLSYVFADTPVPILLVCSNYVLSHPNANGLFNFTAAVDYIASGPKPGVFVSYCNRGEIPEIHYASRILPFSPFSDYLASVYGKVCGKIQDHRFIESEPSNDGENAVLFSHNQRLEDDPACILRVFPHPGMEYPAIGAHVKAVLLNSYHSGTIAVDEKLKHFTDDCASKHIPIYLAGLPMGDVYDTVGEYRRLGVQTLPVSSPVSQYMKLWLAASNGIALERVMSSPCGYDCVVLP